MTDIQNETANQQNEVEGMDQPLNTDSRIENYQQDNDQNQNQEYLQNNGTPDGKPPNGKSGQKSYTKKDYDLPLKKLAGGKGFKNQMRTGRNASHGYGSSSKRLRGMANVGNSIIHGTGFINIYSNPVVSFGRATSRGVK